MKYRSGGAFRRALEDRLRTLSIRDGSPLARLRKMVAFDRFLARLIQYQPDQWAVKGGLALQLRLKEHARTTKDMDLSVIAPAFEVYPALTGAALLGLDDWFSFLVSQPTRPSTGEFGGIRYPIQTLLDGRSFESFHIDVGIGDPMLDPVDYITTSPVLEFAGLEPIRVPCFPLSQQIAEKLHAYTRPRSSGEPSRVKDFVDILLLTNLGDIRSEGLLRAIQATFQFAGTHNLPSFIPPPPRDWQLTFERMAREVGGKDLTLSQAYAAIQQFLDPILSEKVFMCQWDPASWSWKPK
jgi:hypothetical protein